MDFFLVLTLGLWIFGLLSARDGWYQVFSFQVKWNGLFCLGF